MRQQLSRKEVQLAFLQNATEALIEAKSEEEILQVICEAIYRGLQMGRVILFKYDPKWDSFVGQVGFGLGSQHEVQALSFLAKKGLFYRLRSTGEFISVVSQDSEIYGTLLSSDEINRLELKAFAAIPIFIIDEVDYAIIADIHDRNVPIDDESLRSIISLAKQGGMLLERNMLKCKLSEA